MNNCRFLADENFPLPATEMLRQLGYTVYTLQQLNEYIPAIPDERVLELAVNLQATVLTMNRRDFIQLHHQFPNHAGIVVTTFDPDFNALAGRIHQAVASLPTLSGQLIRINREN